MKAEIHNLQEKFLDEIDIIENASFKSPWSKNAYASEIYNESAFYKVITVNGEVVAYGGFHKIFDNFYRKAVKYDKDGIHWSFDPLADFDIFIKEHYKISDSENQKMFKELLTTFGLKSRKRHKS